MPTESQLTWSMSLVTPPWKSLKVETFRHCNHATLRSFKHWKMMTRRITKKSQKRSNRFTFSTNLWSKRKILKQKPSGAMKSQPLTFHYLMFVYYLLCLQNWWRLKYHIYFFSIFRSPCTAISEYIRLSQSTFPRPSPSVWRQTIFQIYGICFLNRMNWRRKNKKDEI